MELLRKDATEKLGKQREPESSKNGRNSSSLLGITAEGSGALKQLTALLAALTERLRLPYVSLSFTPCLGPAAPTSSGCPGPHPAQPPRTGHHSSQAAEQSPPSKGLLPNTKPKPSLSYFKALPSRAAAISPRKQSVSLQFAPFGCRSSSPGSLCPDPAPLPAPILAALTPLRSGRAPQQFPVGPDLQLRAPAAPRALPARLRLRGAAGGTGRGGTGALHARPSAPEQQPPGALCRRTGEAGLTGGRGPSPALPFPSVPFPLLFVSPKISRRYSSPRTPLLSSLSPTRVFSCSGAASPKGHERFGIASASGAGPRLRRRSGRVTAARANGGAGREALRGGAGRAALAGGVVPCWECGAVSLESPGFVRFSAFNVQCWSTTINFLFLYKPAIPVYLSR